MKQIERENKVVFGIAPSPTGPVAVLGITEAAWDYMKDGHTHTFDLTSLGYPVQIMMFGAPTHEKAMEMLGQGAEENGIPIYDLRDKDFSMKGTDE